mmetsp:Transcript_61678/g.144667  ORF Transcript_61678/g.144667 Transcript_61678/m.144667 type:complete len:225 (-) Transcript_61678:1549-2223(-)
MASATLASQAATSSVSFFSRSSCFASVACNLSLQASLPSFFSFFAFIFKTAHLVRHVFTSARLRASSLATDVNTSCCASWRHLTSSSRSTTVSWPRASAASNCSISFLASAISLRCAAFNPSKRSCAASRSSCRASAAFSFALVAWFLARARAFSAAVAFSSASCQRMSASAKASWAAVSQRCSASANFIAANSRSSLACSTSPAKRRVYSPKPAPGRVRLKTR